MNTLRRLHTKIGNIGEIYSDVIVMLIIQIDTNNTNFKTEKTWRIIFNMYKNT